MTFKSGVLLLTISFINITVNCYAESTVSSDLLLKCTKDINHNVVKSILRVESNNNFFAIGINRSSLKIKQPKNATEAIELARDLQKKGHNIDLGLGQINITNLNWLGIGIENIFDPCTNLKALTKIYNDCYQRAIDTGSDTAKATKQALSCYNSGNFKTGFTNGYVDKHKNIFSDNSVEENINAKNIVNLSRDAFLTAKKVDIFHKAKKQDL